MLRKILRSSLFWLLVSLATCIAVYWRWFFTLNIYSWGDWGYVNQELVRQLSGLPQAWLKDGFGMVDIGLPQYLTARLVYSILSQNFPPQVYDRVIYLLPSVLLPAISVYFLVKNQTKHAFAGFIGVLVYCFNSYMLLLSTGELTLVTAYAFGPLLFLLFQATIDKVSLTFALLAGIVGIICSAYDPRGLYAIVLILILYFLYSLFFRETFATKKTQDKIKAFLLSIISVAIIMLANAFWILGFLKTASAYVGTAIGLEIVGRSAFILPRPIVLFTPWWTGNGKDAWGAIQMIPLYFWIIPLVAFLGFRLRRKRSTTLFWAGIVLIGIFLTKNYGEPFGGLYPILYSHIPGFNAFRDSSKFYYFISLGYAVLIGEFIAWLWESKSGAKVIKIAVSFVIAGIFLYNASFLFRQQLGHLMTPRHIPNDYITLKNYSLNQDQFMRTLYIPQTPRWNLRDIEHRNVSQMDLVHSEWVTLNDYHKTGKDYNVFDDLTHIFTKPFANDLLDSWSIKYVVVPLEDHENEEYIYPKGTNMDLFINYLSTLPYLKRINIGTSNLAVFKNENPSPHYVFSPDVQYKVTCPEATRCVFTFQSSAKNVTFYFAESYHPSWKIRLGDFAWWKPLTQKNYFMSDDLHKRTKYGENTFSLPEIKSGQEMTLYFTPQSYVNLGVIISIATVSIVSILLLSLLLWKWKK